MRHLIIDGSIGMDAIHEQLAQELHFPEYYGKNLDALYDCLTEVQEDVELEVINLEYLGRKGHVLQQTILGASLRNPRVKA